MASYIRRRKFLATLGGAAVWPLAASAQQGKIPRIGIIDYAAAYWDPFLQGLRDFGYIEGQNIAYEYRTTEDKLDRLATAMAELVRLPVDVIVTFGTPATRAAKQATATIPIVMMGIGDPLSTGLVASLARPGGNVTGTTILGPEVGPKRLELFKEALPFIARLAFLYNPTNPSNVVYLKRMQAVAPKLGVKLLAVTVRDSSEFDSSLAAMMNENPNALMITGDPLHMRNIDLIVDFATKNRLPTMCQQRDNVVSGALMSYGANLRVLFRRNAWQVQKILQGAKPAALPVEQPTKFDLVLNLTTAKVLGLKVPEAFLLRTDELVE
jgi:putative ABC transport system substrate-binding protein